MYVAACGVAGSKNTTLAAKVAGLQYRLLTACSDALVAMNGFKTSAASVLDKLSEAFRYLYRSPPREDLTVLTLAECEEDAKEMSATAGKLTETFKGLASDAQAALRAP